MLKNNHVGRSTEEFATAVEKHYTLNTIAIDAAHFVPGGKPNYLMSEIDLTMFNYAMTLLNMGHDVAFVVPSIEEKAAAQGFLEYLYSRSFGHQRSIGVEIQAQLQNDLFDILITNRPASFDDVMRFETVSSLEGSLSQQLSKVVPLERFKPKVA